MKKLLKRLSQIALAMTVMGQWTAVQAATISKQTVTARAAVSGTATGGLTLSIRNVSGEGVASPAEVRWSGLSIGSAIWKNANQYIQVTNTYTGSNQTLRVYSDNRAADANPRYTGAISSSTPGAVVATDNTNISANLSWSARPNFANQVVASTSPYAEIDFNQDGDVNDTGEKAGSFQWFYVKDSTNTDVRNFVGTPADVADYVTVANDNGIHSSQGTGGYFPSPTGGVNRIYLGLQQANLRTPRTYLTNKLTLELVTP